MAVQIKLQVLGLKELDRLFRAMPEDVQDKILKSVHKKAMEPILVKARQIAPVQNASERARKTRSNRGGARTIPLKDSIKSVSGGSFQRTGEVGVVRGGALRRKPYRAYHAGLVEFGTNWRKPGGWYAKYYKNAKFTKMPSPNPNNKRNFKPGFIAPAFKEKIDESRKMIVDLMSKRINSTIRRFIRRNA